MKHHKGNTKTLHQLSTMSDEQILQYLKIETAKHIGGTRYPVAIQRMRKSQKISGIAYTGTSSTTPSYASANDIERGDIILILSMISPRKMYFQNPKKYRKSNLKLKISNSKKSTINSKLPINKTPAIKE
jgi:hypothetical protein